MPQRISAPIVGAHFRPPAKDVLNLLPGDTPLVLEREPDNAYDHWAVKVLLPGFGPEGPHAEIYKGCLMQLEAAGPFSELKWSQDSLTDPLHLGYIDSKKTGRAMEFSALMDGRQLATAPAQLTFDMSGKPEAVAFFEEATEDQRQAEVNEKLDAANEKVAQEDDLYTGDLKDDEIPF